MNVPGERVVRALAAGEASTRGRDDRARFVPRRSGGLWVAGSSAGRTIGGGRRLAAIARALVNRPELLLADEPTGNLDRTTAATVARLLLDLQAQERTMLIVVTHSLELAGLLNRRLELSGGRLSQLAAV